MSKIDWKNNDNIRLPLESVRILGRRLPRLSNNSFAINKSYFKNKNTCQYSLQLNLHDEKLLEARLNEGFQLFLCSKSPSRTFESF